MLIECLKRQYVYNPMNSVDKSTMCRIKQVEHFSSRKSEDTPPSGFLFTSTNFSLSKGFLLDSGAISAQYPRLFTGQGGVFPANTGGYRNCYLQIKSHSGAAMGFISTTPTDGGSNSTNRSPIIEHKFLPVNLFLVWIFLWVFHFLLYNSHLCILET
jgi:hypothetical protein